MPLYDITAQSGTVTTWPFDSIQNQLQRCSA